MAEMLSRMFLTFVAYNLLLSVHGERRLVPCYFLFGDSLFDTGNNNNRATAIRANFPPYGVDKPGGDPTGRFSNGLNLADFIAEALGITYFHVPPFANANEDDDFFSGVNYASGGAGILHTTGKQFGDVVSLDEQLQNHQIGVKKVGVVMGNDAAAQEHLNQCLYIVGMGSNDYAAYVRNTSEASPTMFASQLIGEYYRQLTQLYNLGARKVAVFGLGITACVPSALDETSYGPICLAFTQATSGIFNDNLKYLVDRLNNKLAGAQFIYINTYGIMVSELSSNRFPFQSASCCKASPMSDLCVRFSPVCKHRSKYAYFDGIHPSEAAVEILAKRAFAAQSPSDAYPFDIKHLVEA